MENISAVTVLIIGGVVALILILMSMKNSESEITPEKAVKNNFMAFLADNFTVLKWNCYLLILSIVCFFGAWWCFGYFAQYSLGISLGAFSILVFILVCGSLADITEIKPAGPPQLGIVTGWGKFVGDHVMRPGKYFNFYFLRRISPIEATPRDFSVEIKRTFCNVKDVKGAEEKSDEEVKNLKMPTGGGYVHGRISITFIPDDSTAARFQMFLRNGGKHPDKKFGSYMFAQERMAQLSNQQMDIIGKLYTWSTIASSGELVVLRLVRMLTCITPENFWQTMKNRPKLQNEEIRRKLQEMERRNANLSSESVTPLEFLKYMGEIGFPDENGLGIRLTKVTSDLEPEEMVLKYQRSVAVEDLQRKKEIKDINTQLKKAREILADARENGETMTLEKALEHVEVMQRRASKSVITGSTNPVVVTKANPQSGGGGKKGHGH